MSDREQAAVALNMIANSYSGTLTNGFTDWDLARALPRGPARSLAVAALEFAREARRSKWMHVAINYLEAEALLRTGWSP